MKLAYVTTYFYPFEGGAEGNIRHMAAQLARQHDIDVYTLDRKDGKVASKCEELNGLHIYRTKPLVRIRDHFAIWLVLGKLLAGKYDVIHFNNMEFWNSVLVLWLRFLKCKSKLAITPHGVFMHGVHIRPMDYPFSVRLARRLFMPIVKLAGRHYDLAVQVNPFQIEWMENYGIPRSVIRLVPNGVEQSVFNRIASRELAHRHSLKLRRVISYLGRVQEYKGVECVINALPDVAAAYPEVLFVVAGKCATAYRIRLEALVRELNMQSHVIFVGALTDAEKNELLEMSEIFVFPSEWEAFGIAMLEAMAHGNAVISTNTEGGRYLVGSKNGFLYDYGDTSRLKNLLLLLIHAKQLRANMGKLNRELAKQFTWDNAARQLERYYEGLLHGE